jgi:transmembrane sensor
LDKATLILLLEKFRQGKCSAAEETLLQQWLHVLEQDNEQLLITQEEMQQLKMAAWQRIMAARDEQVPNVVIPWYKRTWVRVAAAAAVMLPLALSVVLKHTPQHHREIAMQVISNNSQVIERLHLPDSSVVLLGPHSTLSYPDTYAANGKRPVKLTGKAFFETESDADRPFTVEDATGGVTTVLGTSFLVETNHTFSRVAVVSGKVSVRGNLLSPTQRLTITDGQAVKDTISTSDLLAWAEGQVIIRNASLHELLQIMQSQYGVKTTTTLDASKGNYTLKFPVTMQLSALTEIVERISYQPKIKFVIKDKEVQVLSAK